MVASIISPPLTVQGWILTFSTVFFQAVALVLRIARKPAFVIARNPAEGSPETPRL
ncbi:MAG: hypothetical protein M3072_13585 [Candidatus Dormibacteraeota bacterium]|nr:hypothetical protein [Candidatus Dormibacteraeota bacterium]